jgi:hypothetical protein
MPRLETANDTQRRALGAGRAENGGPGIGSYIGTVGLVGLGLAFIEEELLAGMVIGVAAMAFPKLIPRLGTVLRPALKTVVRAGYDVAARTRETVAEVGEQFQDVVAEVRAEREHEYGEAAPEHEHHPEASTATTASESPAEPDRTKGKRSAKSSTESAETP